MIAPSNLGFLAGRVQRFGALRLACGADAGYRSPGIFKLGIASCSLCTSFLEMLVPPSHNDLRFGRPFSCSNPWPVILAFWRSNISSFLKSFK